MDLGLKGKRVLVTGGSHGIGRAISLCLAEEGCDVAICARDENKISKVVDEIGDRGVKAFGILCDVFDRGQVDRLVRLIKHEWNGVDILVNNVGGGGRWGNEIVEFTNEAVWEEVFWKNTGIARYLTMKFIP